MNRWIQTPHLPERQVTLAAVSGGEPWLTDALERLGIECIQVPQCRDIPSPVSSHPDMLLHHLGGRQLLLFPYHHQLRDMLCSHGAEVIDSTARLRPEYPYDIALNVLRVGNEAFGNSQYTDNVLNKWYRGQLTHTAQGYAKCSCCVVDSRSVITADKGLSAVLSKHGIKVLTVPPGNIELPGYSYGFIGGCCGKIDSETLAFTGSLSQYDQSGQIRAFLLERGVKPLSLTNGPMRDVGSILPLKETSFLSGTFVVK